LKEDYFEIGTIVNVHGLRGEIRVMPSAGDAERFGLLERIEVFFGDKSAEYVLEKTRPHKGMALLTLQGIEDRDASEKLVGGVIKVPRSLAVPLEEDEYYQKDLLDMAVVTESGEELGIISRIIETGANDVYVVQPTSAGKDLLIPAIKECILDVSLKEKKMTVHLLNGLREL